MIDEEGWPRFHLLVSIGGRLDSDSPHLLDFPLSSLTNGIDPYSCYSTGVHVPYPWYSMYIRVLRYSYLRRMYSVLRSTDS